jgi:hypothetical protein
VGGKWIFIQKLACLLYCVILAHQTKKLQNKKILSKSLEKEDS